MVTLKSLCIKGASRLSVNLDDPIYADRLEYELSVIESKGFMDYMFIVADMVHWAKKNGILIGPGRGSSAGSLACYALGVTTIDPIVHGTLFERFIDITRSDYPDIDIDISDERRSELFEYMENRYGKEHVARLGTVGFFGVKSCLKQAASMLAIPAYEPEKAAALELKTLKDTFETEEGKALVTAYPRIETALKFEHHPTHASQHAAGLLVAQSAIADTVAVDARTNCAMLDLEDAAALNLLKIDCLGLTQLSIFERCLKLASINENPNDYFRRIPLDYAPAYEIIDSGHYCGVFQFAGPALQSIAKRVKKLNRFDDLVALSALGRPGPMQGGQVERWIQRRNGEEDVTTLHPSLDDITGDTYGVIVFQEQVIRIAREVAGFSIEDSNRIRKMISKSAGDEAFAQFGKPFIEGAMQKHGMSKETAEEIWQAICGSGSYSFNLAHSVAYGYVSYYCAYLKSLFPVEFAAATLDSERDPDKQIQILRELREEGVNYIPFDAELSGEHWQVATRDDNRVLIGPITNLVSVGPAAMVEILDCRKTGKEIRPSLLARIKQAVTPIDTIYPYRDAINRACPDPAAINIFTTPKTVVELKDAEIVRGELHVLFGVVVRIVRKDHNDPEDVKRRNGKLWRGKNHISLKVYVRDDTGEILCKVNPNDLDVLGEKILKVGEFGNAIWAMKGELSHFGTTRMMELDNARHLGYRMEPKNVPQNESKEPEKA